MRNIVAAAPCAAEPDDTATLNFPIARINTNEVPPLLFILQPLATLHFQPQLLQCPISELLSEMKLTLLFFWILSLLPGAIEDRARVFSLYNSRSKLAVLIDSIRLQLNALLELQSEHSNYLSSTISSSTIETTESLVDFILLQRNLELEHFFNNSQTHQIVGVTSSLIAGEACGYVSIRTALNTFILSYFIFADRGACFLLVRELPLLYTPASRPLMANQAACQHQECK